MSKCPSGALHYMSGGKWVSCNSFGFNKLMKPFKMRKIVSSKITQDVFVKTIKNILKDKDNKNYNTVVKILYKICKDNDEPLTKKGKKRSSVQLLNSLSSKVSKNNKIVSRHKSSKKIREMRPKKKARFGIVLRSRFGCRKGCKCELLKKNKSGALTRFGKSKGVTHSRAEFGNNEIIDNGTPYYGNWKPYSSIKGSAFGFKNYSGFGDWHGIPESKLSLEKQFNKFSLKKYF